MARYPVASAIFNNQFLTLNRGHNELDEPAFTQPLMYHKIRARKSVPVLYEERLVVRSILSRPFHIHIYFVN